MEHEEIIKSFEKIKLSTKLKNELNDYREKMLVNNTTIALMYIESEADSLHQLVKNSEFNKNDVIVNHLQRSIGDFYTKQVSRRVSTKLGYYTSGVQFIIAYVIVMSIAISAIYFIP